MSKRWENLFLLVSGARARLVRRSLIDGGYATTWRSEAASDDELISEADEQIIDCRLGGLVIVAPSPELEQLRRRLERGVPIVGALAADLVDAPDALLGRELGGVPEEPGQGR